MLGVKRVILCGEQPCFSVSITINQPASAASSSSALVRKGSLVAATAASATGLKKQASIAAVSMSPLDVV